ncbi:hypothetical protein LWI29_023529 [Acer saccharum]|uniref:Uncharacterized protein n=1 Tax=Acer saccharum TaxID=4024 RepID=A0AA39RKA6_ACESA|nr:hypothetical protein LWI29_023529 [Acer saccharum]
MLDGEEGQVPNKDVTGPNGGEKCALAEITNQGKELSKDLLLKGKKIGKKGGENNQIKLKVLKGVASSSKGIGDGKGVKHSHKQNQKTGNPPPNIEDLDSVSALCQAQHLPNDATNVSSSLADDKKCTNNPVIQCDNSFEVVASELVEAMALVSECSSLGHAIRDCSVTGDGEEAITEAQLRLNVWLRSESLPKRFNHRNDPSGRRNWGNQGGKSHISDGPGKWRSGTYWKKPIDGESEKQSVNRSRWKEGKLRYQVGELLNLEPNNRSIGKGTAINVSQVKSLAGDNSVDALLNADKAKRKLQMKGISINEGKDRDTLPIIVMNLMEVDTLAGQAKVLGPNLDQLITNQNIRPIVSVLESSKVASTSNQPNKISVGPKVKEVHSVIKWRRAARDKKGVMGDSNLGEILQLGKRGTVIREESFQSEVKKAKSSVLEGSEESNTGAVSVGVFISGDGNLQGSADCDIGNVFSQEENFARGVRPELVTSSKVSYLVEEAPSHLQSADRSLSVRRVQ